jgi:DNA-binding response OmpR family regulator
MMNLTATQSTLAPRVLIVMPEQWRRALLRAALREVGYDAVGTRSLSSALRIRRDEPERGPVRLVILDQSVVSRGGKEQLVELLSLHKAPATILIARPTVAVPEGEWQRVLKRPVSVDEIVSATQQLLPLALHDRHPLD